MRNEPSEAGVREADELMSRLGSSRDSWSRAPVSGNGHDLMFNAELVTASLA